MLQATTYPSLYKSPDRLDSRSAKLA